MNKRLLPSPLDFAEFVTKVQKRVAPDGMRPIARDDFARGNFSRADPRCARLMGKLLDDYLLVGGMLEAVETFCRHGSLLEARLEARKVQEDMLDRCETGFSRGAPSALAQKAWHVWHCLPDQLVKRNQRFLPSTVLPGTRLADFLPAIQWLEHAGLVLCVPCVSAFRPPMAGYERPGMFTVFACDVGLLAALAKIPIDQPASRRWRFVLLEQFVIEQLAAQHFLVYNRANPRHHTVEWAMEHKGKAIPFSLANGFLRMTVGASTRSVPLWAIDGLPAWLDHQQSIFPSAGEAPQ